MNALYSVFPSLYTIGPLPSLLNQIPHNHLASLGSNLWKEDTKCLQSKEHESVVYEFWQHYIYDSRAIVRVFLCFGQY